MRISYNVNFTSEMIKKVLTLKILINITLLFLIKVYLELKESYHKNCAYTLSHHLQVFLTAN